MTDDRSPEELSSQKALPPETVEAQGNAAATAAITRAPEAVKRSMPMALSIMLGILLAGLAAWFFHNLMWFILVLYVSFVAATILEAPVQWLKKHGIRRGLAAVIVMVVGLVVFGGVVWLVGNGVYNQISAVRSNLEQAPQRIDKTVNGILHHVPGFAKQHTATPAASQAVANTVRQDTAAATRALETQPATEPAPGEGEFSLGQALRSAMPTTSTLFENAMTGVEMVSWLVIVYFIVLYMVVDGADHLKTLRCLLPKDSRLDATKLFNEMSQAHRGWALASLSNVGSSTILTGTGLYFLGVPGAYVLGFLAGLGELIPNIGPLIGALPALLLTLVADPDKFFYVVGMFIIIQTVQSYTISPMVMRFGVELPVLVTIISVLVFGMLFGFLGVLVAIPLVADMVVLWGFVSARREKDTTNYDMVNAPPDDRRGPLNPDMSPGARLRKLFRARKRAEAEAAAEASASAPKKN